jgi:hypothetical protein
MDIPDTGAIYVLAAVADVTIKSTLQDPIAIGTIQATLLANASAISADSNRADVL